MGFRLARTKTFELIYKDVIMATFVFENQRKSSSNTNSQGVDGGEVFLWIVSNYN